MRRGDPRFLLCQYQLPEEAARAFTELDNKIVLGRIFLFIPAFKEDKEEQFKIGIIIKQRENHFPRKKSSYKKFKKQQMLETYLMILHHRLLFLNPITIIEGICKIYSFWLKKNLI
ncbi:unnamed protein product [Paramecium octaurelia]|uniref:Uncharacterized protein n=1 Tax=Paramecium octaurelia TaxID=43137 RepID=A0A8S1TJS4_PAROT|nr:unnamed protein product [Paramecium octaurelia]